MEIKDFGYIIGGGISGKHNRITDVPGVRVGQCTVDDGDVHSGDSYFSMSRLSL